MNLICNPDLNYSPDLNFSLLLILTVFLSFYTVLVLVHNLLGSFPDKIGNWLLNVEGRETKEMGRPLQLGRWQFH